MIIDDSTDQLRLMRTVYRMVDPSIQIVTSDDGTEALKLLRTNPGSLPRVMMLDLRMPRKSGYEVLKELKADPVLRLIPVCTFSNSELEEDIRNSYESGASFYFRKPEGLEELKSFIGHFNAMWFEFASHC